jgi:hypothetical protein
MERIDKDRISIPLIMLDGNMETLLEKSIPVASISLRKVEGVSHLPSVILMVSFVNEEQKEAARELGFRTQNSYDADASE